MSDDRALGHIAQDTRILEQDADSALDIPNLTRDQAIYLSFLLEGATDAAALEGFALSQARELTPLQVAAWEGTSAFQEALELLRSDRKTLFHALTYTLFGAAFRAISRLLDSEKASDIERGVVLQARLHGMLIDRVKNEDPSAVRLLLSKLKERKPVSPQGMLPAIEGQFTIQEVGHGKA